MENASHNRPAVLHALFDLRDGVAASEFKKVLESFVDHLKAKGFATGFRMMWHNPMPEFGPNLPEFAYYAAIEFHNLESAEACYDYVLERSEPALSLHRAMNSHVKAGAQFFVSADI
jgi:hypothetical protein